MTKLIFLVFHQHRDQRQQNFQQRVVTDLATTILCWGDTIAERAFTGILQQRFAEIFQAGGASSPLGTTGSLRTARAGKPAVTAITGAGKSAVAAITGAGKSAVAARTAALSVALQPLTALCAVFRHEYIQQFGQQVAQAILTLLPAAQPLIVAQAAVLRAASITRAAVAAERIVAAVAADRVVAALQRIIAASLRTAIAQQGGQNNRQRFQ